MPSDCAFPLHPLRFLFASPFWTSSARLQSLATEQFFVEGGTSFYFALFPAVNVDKRIFRMVAVLELCVNPISSYFKRKTSDVRSVPKQLAHVDDTFL